jgi:hypothetical protein
VVVQFLNGEEPECVVEGSGVGVAGVGVAGSEGLDAQEADPVGAEIGFGAVE